MSMIGEFYEKRETAYEEKIALLEEALKDIYYTHCDNPYDTSYEMRMIAKKALGKEE